MSVEALQPEIDELYEAFARARKPQLRSSDPWQPDVEWIAQQPLRELPAEIINQFVFELGGSIGDGEDVRYLLPRLCELHVLGEIRSVVDFPILFAQQLNGAGWKTWSSREQAAISAFFDSALQWSISERSATTQEWITAVAILFDDLSPWLARIGARDDVAGVWSMRWLAEWIGAYYLKALPPFLEKRPAQVAQIRTWLGDTTSFARVEALKDRIGLTAPDGEDLTQLFEELTTWLYVCGSGQP